MTAFQGPRFATMAEAYPEILSAILEDGTSHIVRRGLETTELINASFTITNIAKGAVPIGIGRKVGPKMMALDGLQLLSGAAWPELQLRMAPSLDRFADTLPYWDSSMPAPKDPLLSIWKRSGAAPGSKFFQGAYGPRLRSQLPAMEKQLRGDLWTRQAVGTLWRESDRNPAWKDRPCTTQIQLMMNSAAKLDIFVSMRANDAWTGVTYDVFQFGQVQQAMAHVLRLWPGNYHHFASSLHLYETDVQKAHDLHWELLHGKGPVKNERETPGPDWSRLGLGEYKSWPQVQERFTGLALLMTLEGREDRDLSASAFQLYRDRFAPRNPVEQWYYQTLNGGVKA